MRNWIIRSATASVTGALLILSTPASAQQDWFSDDFESYGTTASFNGTNGWAAGWVGNPRRFGTSGDPWRVTNGELRPHSDTHCGQEWGRSDCMFGHDTYPGAAGGPRGGEPEDNYIVKSSAESLAEPDFQLAYSFRNADDDSIGMVMRWQDSRNYYAFFWAWDEVTLTVGERGRILWNRPCCEGGMVAPVCGTPAAPAECTNPALAPYHNRILGRAKGHGGWFFRIKDGVPTLLASTPRSYLRNGTVYNVRSRGVGNHFWVWMDADNNGFQASDLVIDVGDNSPQAILTGGAHGLYEFDNSAFVVFGISVTEAPIAPTIDRNATMVTPDQRNAFLEFDTRANRNATWTLTVFDDVNGTCNGLGPAIATRQSGLGIRRLQFTFPGMNPGDSYCWRIRAENDFGFDQYNGPNPVVFLPRLTATTPGITPRGPGSVAYSFTSNSAATGALQYAIAPTAAGNVITTGGSGTYAQAWDKPSLRLGGQHAVETWTRPNATPTVGWSRIVGKGTSANNTLNYSLWLHSGGAAMYRVSDGRTVCSAITNANLVGPRWHHVAGRYDGARLHTYVDGVLRANVACTITPAVSASPLLVGFDGEFSAFGGMIGHVALHNAALSATSIADHAGRNPAARPPVESSTVLAWGFNETPAMQVVFDDSGNANHGFLGSTTGSDARDPARDPTLASTSAAGTNTTSFAGTLTNLTRGQLYAARAFVRAASDTREALSEITTFPAPEITATITPRTQPERADYTFDVGSPRDWIIELLRREGGACTDILQRRRATNAGSVAGIWSGLGPSLEYCWRTTTMGTATVVSEGSFVMAPLPTFTAGPTAAADQLEVDVSATVSQLANGGVHYNDGTCATTHSALVFTRGKVVTAHGLPVPRNAFTISGWVNLAAATQTGTLVSTHTGNVVLRLSAGRLQLEVSSSAGVRVATSGGAVPTNQYVHIAASYDGVRPSVYIDGLNRGSVAYPSTAPVAAGAGLDVTIGEASGGFTGELSALALFDSALGGASLGAQANAGAQDGLTTGPGRIAAWLFDEALGVQSVYDQVNRWPAVLGANHTEEPSDPGRNPAFTWSSSLGSGTDLAATLSAFSGGPTYCYRVRAETSVGIIVSKLDQFVRNIDRTPPTVVADTVAVGECDGNNASRLTLNPPQVSDDFDAPPPTAVPRLGTATGPAITFPYPFGLGLTTVVWVATDSSGNIGTDNQTVRVRDSVAPDVVGGPEVQIQAMGIAGTPYDPEPAARSDGCLDPTLPSFTHDGPALYPLGITIVRFDVVDGVGNRTFATRRVRVVDTTPPEFDPPLQTIEIAHDESMCFEYAPPQPGVRDNAYPASQITIAGQRVSGPGAPGTCWGVGTHQMSWTITDPEGNSRTGSQTVIVVQPTLTITFTGLEVRGVPSPAGAYYNAPVTVRFTVVGGTPGYAVTLLPTPSAVTNNGANFSARYDDRGAYPQIQVLARDEDGTGQNFGSGRTDGFGIDLDPPVIDAAAILDQTGVVQGTFETYPFLYLGESLRLESVVARDGVNELVNLQAGLQFNGTQRVTVGHRPSQLLAGDFTAELWVRWSGASDAVLLSKPNAANTGAGLSFAIRDARVTVSVFADGTRSEIGGPPLLPNRWTHVAAAFNGRVLRYYVDGRPTGSRVISGPAQLGEMPMVLGEGLEGALADVALWNEALTEETLRTHHAGGVGRRITPNQSSLLLFNFSGNTQTINDFSGRANHGVLGDTSSVEPTDPTRTALAHPADDTASGIRQVTVSVRRADSTGSSDVFNYAYAVQGTPLAVGLRAAGGLPCNAPIGAACNAGSFDLDAELISRWDQLREGPYHLRIEARDAAGNLTIARVAFRTQSYRRALDAALAEVEVLIANPLNNSQALVDTRDWLLVAMGYHDLNRTYFDGSYQRADQSAQFLLDTIDDGIDPGGTPEGLSRSMLGAIKLYVRSLTTQLRTPADQALYEDANEFLIDARFSRFGAAWLQANAQSRLGLDGVALLYPPYQAMRNARRGSRAFWDRLLAFHGTGQLSAIRMVQDFTHRRNVEEMVRETRDMLRDTLYAEVNLVLGHRATNERRTLTEILDVIDRSSNDPLEEGDLTAVSDPVTVRDACLDLLTTFSLPDDTYTRCYLRLNDLAREFDTVSEPLVPNYRWRAGMAEVLFNMLELTLFISPTGLPFITSDAEFPEVVMVLPDVIAAQHMTVLPASQVDFPDQALTMAYARFAQARGLLESGDVNAAWRIFLEERCSILELYNRYYSTLRAVSNVADPKEMELSALDFGCGTL